MNEQLKKERDTMYLVLLISSLIIPFLFTWSLFLNSEILYEQIILFILSFTLSPLISMRLVKIIVQNYEKYSL